MSARKYEIVIANGRVIDPETGLDAIRHIGVQGSRIKAVSENPLAGKTVIPASGLVVAPGFIDLKCQIQSIPGDRILAFDGVTTSLELEAGTLTVGAWYTAQAQNGRAINYGTGVAWNMAYSAELMPEAQAPDEMSSGSQKRIDVAGFSTGFAIQERIESALARVDKGLREGGVGINCGNVLVTGIQEALAAFAVQMGVPLFSRIVPGLNNGTVSVVEGWIYMIAIAAATGAHIHLSQQHGANLDDIERCREVVNGAQRDGLQITLDACPYQAMLDRLVLFPTSAIASHAMESVFTDRARPISENAIAYPGMTGAFAHFISNYVSKGGKISLMSAIEKCSLIPAQILEKSVPSMKRKGRLQVGADADVIVFDLNKFEDKATLERPTVPSLGMRYVLVNGAQLISDGELDMMALPGRPVMRSFV